MVVWLVKVVNAELGSTDNVKVLGEAADTVPTNPCCKSRIRLALTVPNMFMPPPIIPLPGPMPLLLTVCTRWAFEIVLALKELTPNGRPLMSTPSVSTSKVAPVLVTGHMFANMEFAIPLPVPFWATMLNCVPDFEAIKPSAITPPEPAIS